MKIVSSPTPQGPLDRPELKALADKCLYLDCVPVLIARRIGRRVPQRPPDQVRGFHP